MAPRLAAFLSFSLALGCGGGGGDAGGSATGEVGAPLTTYVAFVRDNGIASVARGDEAFESSFQIINDANGGMAFDYLGNLYQTTVSVDSDMEETGAVQVLSQASRRSFQEGLGNFNMSFDRELSGFSTTLEAPRSVALAQATGWMFVADSGDAGIKVFGSSAGGDVAPRFTATAAAAPWDLAYQDSLDRLYVTLSDGTIAVFEDFVRNEPQTPTRIIIPSLDGSAQSSTDLRGIAILPSDTGTALVVSDFGAADGGIDGAVYVFDDVSAAAGLTVPDQSIQGPESALGAPLDLAVSADGFLRVVDSEASRVFVYPSAGTRRFAEAPSFSREFENPRAIIVEVPNPVVIAVPASDLDAPVAPVLELIVGTAPAAMPGGPDGQVLRIPADLSGPATAMFDPGLTVGGLNLDFLGNVYTTFTEDLGSGPCGGVRVLNRLATSRGTGADVAFDSSSDRLLEIAGNPFFPVEKPATPGAVEVDETAGLIVLSDPGFPAIWGFGLIAGSDASSLTRLEVGLATGSAEPQQLDYDASSDTLYVAISNGTVFVYENYASQPGEAPDRIITPTNEVGAGQISESLAGLVYDAERDLLIVSDVGSDSGLGNDGALYVFDVASEASGLTMPLAVLSGASTGLDEPVQLAYDGFSVWVADGANGTISRFEDFSNLSGDAAPTASTSVPDVISIALRAQGLSPTTGGSTGQ